MARNDKNDERTKAAEQRKQAAAAEKRDVTPPAEPNSGLVQR